MSTRVLVIGLDSIEPDLVDEMIVAGDLPHLSKIRESSNVATIENHYPFGAGVFWPSMATGVGPDIHGRYYSRKFDPRRSQIVRFRDDMDFKADPFWATLDRESMKGAVIDWPHGPVVELKNGVLIDNWFGHDNSRAPTVHPSDKFTQLEQTYGLDPFGGSTWGSDLSTSDSCRQFTTTILERIETKGQMGVDLLGENDWDHFCLGFADAHDVGHLFWHLHDPAHEFHDPSIADAIGDPLRDCYKSMDAAIGKVVEAVDDTTLLYVIGGPGMRPFCSINPAMKKICQALQRSSQKPLSERSGEIYAASLSKRFRKMLQYLAKAGRAILEQNEHKKQKFWSVDHNANAGAIRINLKGREKSGLVEPGEEYDNLCTQIEADFRAIKNTATGNSIVEDVFKVHDQLDGANVNDLPDLFIVWKTNETIHQIASPKVGEINISRHQRSGDHTPYGFLWSREGVDGATLLPASVTAILEKAIRSSRR